MRCCLKEYIIISGCDHARPVLIFRSALQTCTLKPTLAASVQRLSLSNWFCARHLGEAERTVYIRHVLVSDLNNAIISKLVKFKGSE